MFHDNRMSRYGNDAADGRPSGGAAEGIHVRGGFDHEVRLGGAALAVTLRLDDEEDR